MERVHFILEDGFRGIFVVEEDIGATPAPRNSDGTWIYKMNAGARIRTQSLEPLRQWHETGASYADGVEIPFSAIPPSAPPLDSTTKLRPLFATATRHYYLVGTEKEFLAATRDAVNITYGHAPPAPKTKPHE